MTDEKRLQLINEFIASLSVVEGGNIKVTKTDHSTHYEPKEVPNGMKFEDCEYLTRTLDGAEQFLWFLARNNYDIVKSKKFKKNYEQYQVVKKGENG